MRETVRLTVERDVAVPMRDGTVLYADVYRPLVRLLQAHGLKRRFPGAHSSDLVAMVDAFRECQRRCDEVNLDWEEAVARFARRPAEAA